MPSAAAGLVGRRQDDGARAVAEQDAGAPVGVVEEPGQQLRPDHEHVLGQPAGDVRLGGREARRRSPEQAAITSIAAARVLPIASLTRAAVDGIQ